MSPVRGSKCIVDVAVCIRSESLDKLLLAGLYGCLCCLLLLIGIILSESARLAFLFSVIAKVLEKQRLARLECGSLLLCLLAVLCKLNRHAETL